MNMMFIIDGTLVTAELSDTILPGITRDSILTLAKDMNMPVEVRKVAVQELYDASLAGTLQEAFGTGTAAVISPVGELTWEDKSMIINDRKIGPIAQRFYDTLTAIQRQRMEDKHGWTTVVPRFLP